jgi:hypothetical protein
LHRPARPSPPSRPRVARPATSGSTVAPGSAPTVRPIARIDPSSAWRWAPANFHEPLLEAHPAAKVPARAAIHRILVRHGRVRRRRRSLVRTTRLCSNQPSFAPALAMCAKGR